MEALATSVVERALSKRSVPLDEFRREDLLADLIAYTWELSLRYDVDTDRRISQARGRRPGFEGWATYWLRLRLIDWIRKTEGRTRWAFSGTSSINPGYRGKIYERERPIVVSLDGELAESLESRRLDSAPHSDPDFRGALDRGDSPAAWEAVQMGARAPGRASRRAA